MGDEADSKITRAADREGSIREGSTDGNEIGNDGKIDAYGDEVHVVDHEAERRLCRKLDFRLMPVLAIMCKTGTKRSARCSRSLTSSTQTCSTPSTRETSETPRPTA